MDFDAIVNGIKITEKVILIHITRSYPRLMAEHHAPEAKLPQLYPKELYNATRAAWNTPLYRAQNYKLVFCVYKRLVREIYEVRKWERAIDKVHEYDKSENGDRIRFAGLISCNRKLRETYLNKDVSEYFSKNGNDIRNPIGYVN